jgi:hypothetical protein
MNQRSAQFFDKLCHGSAGELAGFGPVVEMRPGDGPDDAIRLDPNTFLEADDGRLRSGPKRPVLGDVGPGDCPVVLTLRAWRTAVPLLTEANVGWLEV